MAHDHSEETANGLKEVDRESSHHEENSEQSSAHNHETDHGEQSIGVSALIKFTGKFHPMVVHFPIALGIAALMAEICGMVFKKQLFRSAGRFVIVLGALSALAAAPLGWIAAASSSYPSLESTLEWHRWIGLAATGLLVGSAVMSELAARKENATYHRGYVALLIIAALMTGFAGHLGATLIYGPEHFSF